MSTVDFERARSEEMRRIRRSRPRYGYDARRRAKPCRDAERAQRDAKRTKRTRTLLVGWLIILSAVGVFIVGWDHTREPFHLNRPVEPANSVTSGAAR